MAIKQSADGAPDAGILPEAAAVIFDEAHELEEVASSYFGVSISNLRFDQLVRDVENTLRMKSIASAAAHTAGAALRERSPLFFSLVPAGEGRFAFESRPSSWKKTATSISALGNALQRLGFRDAAHPREARGGGNP